MSSMERTHIDTFTENRINNIKGKLLAQSNYGKFFYDIQEIDIYNILNITILSATNIKSNNSIHLIITGKQEKIELTSDENIIKSDYSNASNRWIPELSYYLSKK